MPNKDIVEVMMLDEIFVGWEGVQDFSTDFFDFYRLYV